MKLWMIYNKEDYKKNKTYYDMHVSKGKKYNMDIQLIIAEYLSFGVKNNKLYVEYYNKDITLPDGIIMRCRYSMISKQLELMNVPVYNNSFVCDICNDKFKTYQFLANKGIDMVDSEYMPNYKIGYSLNDENYNLNNIDNHIYDLDIFKIYNKEKTVIKTTDGHGGDEVYILDDFLHIQNTKVDENLRKDMVLQPLVNGDNKDLRVYILDNKIVGCVLRQSNTSFKSNYSLGGSICSYTLSKDEENNVRKIIDLFKENTKEYPGKGIFYGGIDFIIDKRGKLLFNEIEDVVGSRMLYNTSNIDIVDEYLRWLS